MSPLSFRILSRRRLFQISGGAVLSTAAAPALGRDISRADLTDDITLLRDAYEALHPGLYQYNSQAQMNGRFERLSVDWAAAPDLPARFLALTRLTAAIRCGHTYPNPFNQRRATMDELLGGARLVPFQFVWLDGCMVVTRDRSPQPKFTPGDQIIAVNGVPSETLLALLTPLSRADGGADAKRVNNMEMRGDTEFETFDIHLPLVLPSLGDTARFTLADGRVVTASLLTAAERSAALPPSVTDSDGAAPIWTFEPGDHGVARLTMPTWATFNSDWDWATWLARVLDSLEGEARGLVIDLRGNEGGLGAVGDLIASRLTAKNIRTPRALRFTRYRQTPDRLNPHLDTWDDGFRDWGARATGPGPDGFYRLTPEGEDQDGIVRPAGRRFGGPVAVLCDASNSSATFGFAQMVQDARLATLVGAATGGSRRRTNGGYFFLTLPASGLEVDLPHTAILADPPQPDTPVVPDVRVGPDAATIRAGLDPQLAAATCLILNR